MHLLVDGYNVIKTGLISLHSKENLSLLRENLIRKLCLYKSNKPHKVTVVFDGFHSDNISRTIENVYGIKVIYSKQNETADEVIKEIVENSENKGEILVVTSDNELKNAVKIEGASIVSSDSLTERLKHSDIKENISKAEYIEKYIKGYEEEQSPVRKGNPIRKKKKRIKNLW